MASNIEKQRKELNDLILKGNRLFMVLQIEHHPEETKKALKGQVEDFEKYKKTLPNFRTEYQNWYTEARAVLTVLLPDRLPDFVKHYEKPKGRKDLTFENYRIEDCLQGVVLKRGYTGETLVDPSAAIPHMQQQAAILSSVERKFESTLFDIRKVLQADLFDSEIDAAKELAKNGYLRASGAVIGVVIEHHLQEVASNHKLSVGKSRPTISTLNDLLKENTVIDVPMWRFIQRLGDLRNLCDHKKTTDPKKEDIDDLIAGAEKITKEIS